MPDKINKTWALFSTNSSPEIQGRIDFSKLEQKENEEGVRTYLYLNGERVAVNNLYNTNHGQYYYGSDILGSVRFITGQAGQELNRIEYDVFGGIYKGNSPYGLETGYTGKPYDSVTGLSDYGFRDYSPTHARFITEDPIRDGENWFAYVGNNPVNWVDPWGLSRRTASLKKRSVNRQLKYLHAYTDKEYVTPQDKADAARELRNNMRRHKKDKFDLDALLTGEFGDEKFINETLRDFLNTSDTGDPYSFTDIEGNKEWNPVLEIGAQEHQKSRHPEHPNRKFTNADGREVVFTTKDGENWEVSTNERDKGTYNYATNPSQFSASSEHGRWDMDPYFRQFGITPWYRKIIGYAYSKEAYNKNGKSKKAH